MMIRRYTKEDVDGVVSVCKEFTEISTMSGIPYVEEDMKEFMLSALDCGSFFQNVLLCPRGNVVGVCAFYVSPPPFNHSVSIASEAWWYVIPEYRKGTWAIRLLNKTIEECVSQNVRQVTLTLEEHLDKRMHSLYDRLGFKKKESTYFMERE